MRARYSNSPRGVGPRNCLAPKYFDYAIVLLSDMIWRFGTVRAINDTIWVPLDAIYEINECAMLRRAIFYELALLSFIHWDEFFMRSRAEKEMQLGFLEQFF